ncbi:DNA recombination protein RmuC [Fibrobacterota bacterium]
MAYNILYLVTGLMAGGIVIWVIRKYKFESEKGMPRAEAERLKNDSEALKVEKGRLEERAAGLDKSLEERSEELEQERKLAGQFQVQAAELKSENAHLREKLDGQKEELEKMQEKFKAEFENLANKILEDKSTRFTEQNKANLDEILKPLGEKIKDFQKRVEETYDKESKMRYSLKDEIIRLSELNMQMSKEANNLTRALKGDSKTQGNWGEMVLQRVLEKSGLEKGREFLIQESMQTEEGNRQQPDVVLVMPESKNMVVDSKVSLSAYERYVSAEDESQKEAALKEHIASIKNHVKGLSEKSYQNLYQINTPDFVLMFLPVESAFVLAVQNDENIFIEAFNKNIVIVSPSTLLATLRTIASIWRQEKQTRHAIKIATESGRMYDKFTAFVYDLEDIGKKLQLTQKAYGMAHNKLTSGAGNLVKKAEDIKKLGAKAAKALPGHLVEHDDEDGEEDLG